MSTTFSHRSRMPVAAHVLYVSCCTWSGLPRTLRERKKFLACVQGVLHTCWMAAFGTRGQTVALLARGEKDLAGAAEYVRSGNGTPVVLPLDLCDTGTVYAAVDRIEAEIIPSNSRTRGRSR